MCRNIRPLFNFDPPATDAELRAASLQFVRKRSGFTRVTVNTKPYTTSASAPSAHARRGHEPGRSIVKPPSETAAKTSSASAPTIR